MRTLCTYDAGAGTGVSDVLVYTDWEASESYYSISYRKVPGNRASGHGHLRTRTARQAYVALCGLRLRGLAVPGHVLSKLRGRAL